MEGNVPSSQLEEGAVEKRKTAEGMSTMYEQQRAAARAKEGRIRSFRWEPVEIKTVNGVSFLTRMWVSDEEPAGITAKIAECFACEVCSKVFDKKQKLLLHARFHTNKS